LEDDAMNTNDTKKTINISEQELAVLGGGALAYIREIEESEAERLLGADRGRVGMSRLFCLYNADGTPVSISGTKEAAIGSAFEHELMPMSVH
jgi:hypothetical protein